ncbi:uncharacterized protein C2orf42 homolog isoform X2 [Parambassis ranga]|uniref:Uncharacterized protein C2orf42 homolog isoform X2 n=1 Tax=Parambassis ranga TaxID=210632 RepID=A0A6P7JC94_9TELE|nr:uncharacterized protein C2orf42 homolog isoform X2 [Parambassis ranga]
METEVSSSLSIVTSAATQPNHLNLEAIQRDRRKSASTPAFLSNLGRATLRGVRKCPKCGVYNGIRGVSCKNKTCGLVLRESSAGTSSKSSGVEVVRVIIDSEETGGKEQEGEGGTDGGAQVFSVCHKRKGLVKGATCLWWSFVELVPTETTVETGDGATMLTRINLGRCFFPSCRQGQRLTQNESESDKQSPDSLCVHIKEAIECQRHATPLTFKSSVLEGLEVSIQAKEELWRLATESPGPLVQRVSKDTLVVKCHVDSNHPLGLLHVTVSGGRLLEASKGDGGVFQCACQPSPGSVTTLPCLHFYACVCAFLSDEKLASEFANFISYTCSGVQQNAPGRTISPSEKPVLKVELISSHHRAKKLRLDESVSAPSVATSPSEAGTEGVSASSLKKAGQRNGPGAGSTRAVDERMVSMGFHQWLASVTERIHQMMHYQFDGKPQPLVYHIPQDFFNALQQRLSHGSKKRRLPNFTTAFVRNDGLPLGTFSKYTWHITSLMQVKRIFDTPELPLEVTQSFVRNMDGSYSRFRCPEPPPELELPVRSRTDRPQAIRPMELRTFLKVGPGTADQKDTTPFVIEWIPDVLPRCHMGELRISFEFGHEQSGQHEYYKKMTTAEKGGRNKSECSQPKITKTVQILHVTV